MKTLNKKKKKKEKEKKRKMKRKYAFFYSPFFFFFWCAGRGLRIGGIPVQEAAVDRVGTLSQPFGVGCLALV